LTSPKKDNNPFKLIKCDTYIGEVASGNKNSQPFSVDVHSNSLLLSVLHCHLSNAEVIGLLGGSWDKTTKKLVVLEAYPCNALQKKI